MVGSIREPPRGLRVTATRFVVLAASIGLVSIFRYSTGPGPSFPHELSLRLYYVPILVAAYWYGVAGGLLAAAVCAIAYLNRMFPAAAALDPDRLAEVVVFHLMGLVVGLLSSAQRRVTAQYQHAAATLEDANSRLRESHEQIRRIDRLKTLGEVATGLAHEIRHPIASIGGALEIIQSRAEPNSPEAEFSRLAMAEVQRLDGLVWEFLRYARPHDPELRLSSVRDIVVQAVTLLRVEASRNQVTIDYEEPLADVDAHIDPLQIEQVLLNVILNAIQATSPGGRVTIAQRLDNNRILIDVVDEGPGIAPEHLARIFSPFFTTREKGTGLGLAIAHRIVMSHDGQIDVIHTSPRGTHFRITLPVRLQPAAVAQSPVISP